MDGRSKAGKLAKLEAESRRKAAIEEARAVLTANRCPQCGAGIRRNLALTGWIQCEQYGSEGFRKDSAKPACSYQAFTV